MDIFTYPHILTHAHAHLYTQTHIHILNILPSQAQVYTLSCTLIYSHMHAHTCTYSYTFFYTHIFGHIYIYNSCTLWTYSHKRSISFFNGGSKHQSFPSHDGETPIS